jgi:hypothetical protein
VTQIVVRRKTLTLVDDCGGGRNDATRDNAANPKHLPTIRVGSTTPASFCSLLSFEQLTDLLWD